jgi:hypothetical protein
MIRKRELFIENSENSSVCNYKSSLLKMLNCVNEWTDWEELLMTMESS